VTGFDDIYDAARVEMAEALGLDIENLAPGDRLQLSAAVALRLELDKFEAEQRSGRSVDLVALTKVTEALRSLIEPDEPEAEDKVPAIDLKLLSDRELGALHLIMLKAHGRPAEDALAVLAWEPGSENARVLAELEAQVGGPARPAEDQSRTPLGP
jgi:hypothetical protein